MKNDYEKKITWNISPFPERLKNLFVAKAKEHGIKVPILMENVVKEFLKKHNEKENY